jgi:hypothetical protein
MKEETVKKKLLVVVTLVLLAMASALPSTALTAPSPRPAPRYTPVAGEWSWTGGEFIADDIIDGRQYFHGHEHGSWTGTFEGTSHEVYFGVIYPSGYLWAVIFINFTGTVDGVSGGAVIRLSVSAPPNQTMGGRWKVVRGTGGLRGLRGSGTWVYTGDSADLMTSYADYNGVYRLP